MANANARKICENPLLETYSTKSWLKVHHIHKNQQQIQAIQKKCLTRIENRGHFATSKA